MRYVFFCCYEGLLTISSPNVVYVDIPQCSVRGPKLIGPKIQIALYADDTVIYSHSFSRGVANKKIQIHIDKLQKYWDSNTETIVFRKKFINIRVFSPLKIYVHKTLTTNTVKYLGVYLDNTLRHRTHLKKSISTSQNLIRLIYPLLVKYKTLITSNKILLYIA